MTKAILYVAIGGNLLVEGYDTLLEGLEAAASMLPKRGIGIQESSLWYQTAAVPVSDQPDFLNAVLRCETDLSAKEALQVLHEIEAYFGRVRSIKNAERTVDLDMIDFDGRIIDGPDLTLPHPRLHERAFVLYPLRDVAPHWRHPVLNMDIKTLLKELPAGQEISRFSSD